METASPTRRAAIVNWLHINAVFIFNTTSDEEIEDSWKRYSGIHRLKVSEIVVKTRE